MNRNLWRGCNVKETDDNAQDRKRVENRGDLVHMRVGLRFWMT